MSIAGLRGRLHCESAEPHRPHRHRPQRLLVGKEAHAVRLVLHSQHVKQGQVVVEGGHCQLGGASQPGVVDDGLVAFIGLPWPMNRTGMVAPVSGASASLGIVKSVAIENYLSRAEEATVSAATMEPRAKIRTGTPNTSGKAASGLSSPPPPAVLRSAARRA